MDKSKIREFVERMSVNQQKMSEGFKFKLNEDFLKLDLGLAHLMVMKQLSNRPSAPIITELTKNLSISAPMMTHIIDKLESSGLVQRTRDESDRRIIKIAPTKKGKDMIRKFDEEHIKRTIEFINQLDEKEQAEFMSSVTTLMSITMKYYNKRK
ncbi:MAG: hypothetical protein A2252_02835 [Elusimicrobia bacterium RIFOXYA2_FULL_39_19]|nr:MAG: hypothetical protein A2252_02835 [Elusimicrobia bacterium RIFOXYA2_FULL_39_19]